MKSEIALAQFLIFSCFVVVVVLLLFLVTQINVFDVSNNKTTMRSSLYYV